MLESPLTRSVYERRGVAVAAPRSGGGFRLLGRMLLSNRFIKQEQELGLTMDEIKGLLTPGGAEECRRVHDLLSKKIGELDDKMTAMKDFRRTLARHLSACEGELQTHGDSACCPVVAGGKSKPPRGKSGKK